MGIRTRWVAKTLFGDQAAKARTPEQFDEALRRALRREHFDELRDALLVGSESIEAANRAAEAAKAREFLQTRPSPSPVQCWACRAPLMITAATRGKTIRCSQCRTKQKLPS